MRAVRFPSRRFLRDARAVSAIEFAIWAPLLSLLLLGGVEVTRYEIATGRLSDVAGTMGQMLSVNTSGTVNYIDLQFYHDSAMITYPSVLKDAAQQNVPWSSDMAITMTSVTFTATPAGCTSGCTYVPKVVWSSGNNKRSCTKTMTATSDTSAPSVTTLPADVFGPTSVLVIDVLYTFRPIVTTVFFGPVTIARSYYVTPRYVPTVNYQVINGDPNTTSICT